MTTRDNEIRVRPGRISHGNRGAKRAKTFIGEVMRAAKRAGHTGKGFGGPAARHSAEAVGQLCRCRRDLVAAAS